MTICRECQRTMVNAPQQRIQLVLCQACRDALTDELTRPAARRDPFYVRVDMAAPKSSPVAPVPFRKTA